MTGISAYTMTDAERGRIERIDQLVLRGAAATDELLDGLSDPSWTVRRAAVGALAALGDESVTGLCAWLRGVRSSEHAIAAAVDALAAALGETVTPAVIALLADPAPAVIADAATVLGRRRAVGAAPALGPLLAHPDDNVAVAAIEALGSIGGSVAIEPMIAIVRRKEFFRTFPAIQVLSRSGDPRAITPLAELLDDELFRLDAVRALGRTGAPHAIAPLARLLADASSELVRVIGLALADLRERAAWTGGAATVEATLRELITPSRGALITAMSGGDPTTRAALATMLGAVGDASTLGALAPLLGDPELRAAAAAAVQRIGSASEEALLVALRGDPALRVAALPAVSSARAAAEVRQLLTDPDAEVRARACDALARIGDTSAVTALFAALDDASPRVAQAATAAIHSLGSAETPALVLATLASPRMNLRRHALRIIAYLGCAGAYEAVRAAVDDADQRLAELAAVALGALDDPRVDGALLELALAPREGVRGAVMRAAAQRSTEPARNVLERGLADDAAWVRYYACQGVGRLAMASSTNILITRMADAAPHVRIAAIEALARLDTPQAWQALTSAARSPDPDEQRAALVGIGQHGRSAALPYLIEALRSTDIATRLIGLAGLVRVPDPRALAALAAACVDAVPEVRDAALSLLAERPDRSAAELLVATALETPLDHPVHLALSRPGPGRVSAIAERLERAEDPAATVLASALARINDPEATAALVAALAATRASVRRSAATALIAIGAAGARARVARLATDDPDPDVRRACAALAAG